MKKNYDYAFSLGFVLGLQKNLIEKAKIRELENCKNLTELEDTLKSIKYRVSNFKSYEEFCEKLDIYFKKTIKDIEGMCPEKNKFCYIFCKNDFLNFKTITKFYFKGNTHQEIKTASPYCISPTEIKKSVETKNFENIKSPFKKIFAKNFERMENMENKKLAEIFLDKDMYKLMIELCKDDSFLTKNTKLEITLKNIDFCVRYLRYNFDLEQLDNYILADGYIEKQEYIKAAKKNIKSLYDLLEKIDIKNYDENEDIEIIYFKKIEELYNENTFSFFCFTPIYIYIKNLEKEIKLLKETAIKIVFKNIS